MNKLLMTILRMFFLSVALLVTGARAATPEVATVVIQPWEFSQQPDILSDLGKIGINTVTIYVPWRDVEPQEGVFVFDDLDWQMKKIQENEMKVILMLDFGGRIYFDKKGRHTEHSVVPDWFQPKYPAGFMRNSSGEMTRQPSLVDDEVKYHVSRFIEQAVTYFDKEYRSDIFGFAIGLQEEHEIKFGQEGYVWRDYSDLARTLFREKYQQDMPTINYNNNVADATPKIDALYPKLQAAREAALKQTTCHYAEIIQNHKQNAVAYFGEVFTSHDAIYAAGVVEELADCIDIAVIDFNFYDGYELKPEPYTLPMLANYLENTGYEKVIVGAYAERWAKEGRTGELSPVIQESLQRALHVPSVIGYEIGGFYETNALFKNDMLDVESISRAVVDGESSKEIIGGVKIGLLASKNNFYFWHGEHSNERNVHQDALTRAYELLEKNPNVEVAVIGESALKNNDEIIQTLDALVVPHQASLPAIVKEKLKEYWSSGGVLIQDMRLGEFDDTGKSTGDWLHDVFGIAGLEWSLEPGRFEYDDVMIELDMESRIYSNHAVLHAAPDHEVRAKLVSSSARSRTGRLRDWLARRLGFETSAANQGLILRGERSLAFGFLPQLTEGVEQSRWHRIFVDEILDVVEDNQMNSVKMEVRGPS